MGHYSWVNSGEIYEGEWVKGIRHGKGVWKKNNLENPNGYYDSYVG